MKKVSEVFRLLKLFGLFCIVIWWMFLGFGSIIIVVNLFGLVCMFSFRFLFVIVSVFLMVDLVCIGKKDEIGLVVFSFSGGWFFWVIICSVFGVVLMKWMKVVFLVGLVGYSGMLVVIVFV